MEAYAAPEELLEYIWILRTKLLRQYLTDRVILLLPFKEWQELHCCYLQSALQNITWYKDKQSMAFWGMYKKIKAGIEKDLEYLELSEYKI